MQRGISFVIYSITLNVFNKRYIVFSQLKYTAVINTDDTSKCRGCAMAGKFKYAIVIPKNIFNKTPMRIKYVPV